MEANEAIIPTNVSEESVYRPPMRAHFGRRLSGAPILASYDPSFPIVEPEKIAQLNELISKFPTPPVMELPVSSNNSNGSASTKQTPPTGKGVSTNPGSGSGWSIKGIAASLFSKS